MTNLHTIVCMELKLLVFSFREKLVQELRWPRKEVTINKSCSWVVKPREIDFFSSFLLLFGQRKKKKKKSLVDAMISHRVMRLRQDEEKPTNVDFPG